MSEAFESSKYLRVLNNQIDLMKVKIGSRRTLGYGGGLFEATPETILFIKLLVDGEHEKDVVILDKNDLPIKIGDPRRLMEDLIGRYTEIVNEAYAEYSRLQEARTVEKLLNE